MNTSFTEFIKKVHPEILVLSLFSVGIHLAFMNNLEYHRDELLYFSLGTHPDFGYVSVPPLIGWIAWIMEKLFGASLFAVRLFPAVISGLMVILVSSFAKEFGGKRYAGAIAAIGILIAVFALRSFSLYMPVHLDIFFWTLVLFLIVKYINTGSDRYLILFGLVAGLSLLNKYLIGLLFAIILVVIPFTQYRSVFKKKMFWVGLGTGFLVFLPNIIWQITHGMPVFSHLSELARTQLVHVNTTAFLTEQLVSPGVASILTIAGLIYLLVSRYVRRYRFLAVIIILVIASLLLMRGKSYYTIGVFPLLIAAGAVSVERLLKSRYFRLFLPIIMVLITWFILPFGLPIYKTEGLKTYFNYVESKYGIDLGRTFEDGSKHSLPQDYADMLGWEELTIVANKAYNMIEDKNAAFIYCENYGQASAITIIGRKYGLPEAVCFSESYRYWFPRQFNPDITSLIYINGELGDDIKLLFRNITEVGRITNPDAREYGTTVFLCREPVISFNKFWENRIKDLD